MKKLFRIFIFLIVPSLFILGVYFVKNNAQSETTVPVAWLACATDEDCIAINKNCCAYDTPINKSFLLNFRKLYPLAQECAYVECAIGTLPTRCINHVCTIINTPDKGPLS